jgi:hypothetical protein
MPSAIPVGQFGATDPGSWPDKIVKVITPATEVTNVDASGGDFRWLPSGADQDWCQDRAPADSVDAAGASHRGPHEQQDRSRDQPHPAVGPILASWPGQRQPKAERKQHATTKSKTRGPGQQLDADDRSGDDAGHGPGDKYQGQAATGLSLPPVPVQRAGRGDHVEQQVVEVTAGLGVPSTRT